MKQRIFFRKLLLIRMDPKCAEPQEYINYLPFYLVLISQTLAGLISIATSVYVLLQCRYLYFHRNCKLLIFTVLVLDLIHSISVSSMQIIHLTRYMLISDPCKIPISGLLCTIIRFPSTFCFTAFISLQLAMVFERVLATYWRADYEKSTYWIGVALIISSLIFSFLAVLWTVLEEHLDSYYGYCSAATPYTSTRLSTLLIMLTIFGIVSLFGFIIIRVYNQSSLKRKTYDLRSSFQISENLHVIRLLWPLTLFNTLCFGGFTITGAILPYYKSKFSVIQYKTIFAGIYVIPYLTIISPLILLYIIRKAKVERSKKLNDLTNIKNENDQYFDNYSKMWNKT